MTFSVRYSFNFYFVIVKSACILRQTYNRKQLVLLYNIQTVPIKMFVCEANKNRFENSSKKNMSSFWVMIYQLF